ncbi:hypothetical protein Q4485_14945 [Granulosicoccaceae sp. 1_MG-2023]|nr:hypothetical protein [Granulosicoccaceae sp. 1_MG-2023]
MNSEETIKQAGSMAAELRRGKHVAATLALPDLLEAVMQTAPAAEQAALQGLIHALLVCQEKRDWTGMADYLEFELPTLLGSAPLIGQAA